MSPIRLLAALMLAAAFVAPHVVARGRTSLASEQLQTDTTETVGADKGASGLAATPGADVTVHYDSHGTARVATKIVVRAKQ